MSNEQFYQSLSPLEQEFWHKLDAVFQQVHPQKPAKGIEALLKRAQTGAAQDNVPLELALEEMLQGAIERTTRRVQLLNQCRLNPNKPEE